MNTASPVPSDQAERVTNTLASIQAICADKAKNAVDNAFRYHAPKLGQPEKYEALRAEARQLAYLIIDICPESRERSKALTDLQQAIMWANAAIACNS